MTREIVLHHESGEEHRKPMEGTSVSILVDGAGNHKQYALKWEFWYWGMGHPDGGENTVPLPKSVFEGNTCPEFAHWLMQTEMIPGFIREEMDEAVVCAALKRGGIDDLLCE